MLDQHAAEAFHAAKWRAVDHDGAVRLVVRADVAEVKAHGQDVIDLHGAELPFAADDILDDEIDLRTVEGGLAGLLGEGHAERGGSFAAGVFGGVPLGGIAGELAAVRIAKTHADAVIVHAKRVEHDLHQREAAEHFGGHLFLGAEEMCVILREAADAGHAVELARLLPAVNRAELRQTHRHVAVAVRSGAEDLRVVRAVHRLEHEPLDELVVGEDAVFGDRLAAGPLVEAGREAGRDTLDAAHHVGARAAGGAEGFEGVPLDDRGELRILVVREVARGLVKLERADVRREDLGVPLLLELGADEGLKLLADDGALGGPEDEALADGLVDVEQAEGFADDAVVALGGFLLLLEVLVELGLGGEGGAVDADQAV